MQGFTPFTLNLVAMGQKTPLCHQVLHALPAAPLGRACTCYADGALLYFYNLLSMRKPSTRKCCTSRSARPNSELHVIRW